MSTKFSDCWQPDLGIVPDYSITEDTMKISDDHCVTWCAQDEECEGVVSSSWHIPSCFKLVKEDTSQVVPIPGWSVAYRSCFIFGEFRLTSTLANIEFKRTLSLAYLEFNVP